MAARDIRRRVNRRVARLNQLMAASNFRVDTMRGHAAKKVVQRCTALTLQPKKTARPARVPASFAMSVPTILDGELH